MRNSVSFYRYIFFLSLYTMALKRSDRREDREDEVPYNEEEEEEDDDYDEDDEDVV